MEEKEDRYEPFRFVPPSVPPAVTVAGEPLGISANFASVQENQGFSDTPKNKFAEEQRSAWQAERRKIRSASQKILFKTGKFSRLRSCGRAPLFNHDVEIRKADSGVYFSGLETCGNSWACPVCAPRIQYFRGIEIGQAMEKAYSEKMTVYMFTYTHPHHKGQELKELNRRHNKARRYFKSGRWFQGWIGEHGYKGGITAAEVTWAIINGWHWHSHELVFVRGKLTRDDIHILKLRWLNCLKRAGFEISEKDEIDVYIHGLDISIAHSSDYLVKMGLRGWGAEKEVQGGGVKVGRDADGVRHYSPFELLEKGYEKEWVEYVEATKGLCQVQWTRGLKEWASVEEKTDEQIALALEADVQDVAQEQGQEQKKEQEQAEPDLLAIIPKSTWYVILGNEWREELLKVARDKGKQGIDDWAQQKKLDIRVPGIINKCMQEFGGVYVCEDDIPA